MDTYPIVLPDKVIIDNYIMWESLQVHSGYTVPTGHTGGLRINVNDVDSTSQQRHVPSALI